MTKPNEIKEIHSCQMENKIPGNKIRDLQHHRKYKCFFTTHSNVGRPYS